METGDIYALSMMVEGEKGHTKYVDVGSTSYVWEELATSHAYTFTIQAVDAQKKKLCLDSPDLLVTTLSKGNSFSLTGPGVYTEGQMLDYTSEISAAAGESLTLACLGTYGESTAEENAEAQSIVESEGSFSLFEAQEWEEAAFEEEEDELVFGEGFVSFEEESALDDDDALVFDSDAFTETMNLEAAQEDFDDGDFFVGEAAVEDFQLFSEEAQAAEEEFFPAEGEALVSSFEDALTWDQEADEAGLFVAEQGASLAYTWYARGKEETDWKVVTDGVTGPAADGLPSTLTIKKPEDGMQYQCRILWNDQAIYSGITTLRTENTQPAQLLSVESSARTSMTLKSSSARTSALWNSADAYTGEYTETEEGYDPQVTGRLAGALTKTNTAVADESMQIDYLCDYKGLLQGVPYLLSVTLADPETGEALTDDAGKELRASKALVPEESEGSTTLSLSFDGTGLAERKGVLLASLTVGETTIASHDSLTDLARTIYFLRRASDPNMFIKKAVTADKGLKLKWKKVKDAEGYDLFVSYCGESFGDTPVLENMTGYSCTLKKLYGEKLNQKKNLRYQLKAYVYEDGEKVYTASSLIGHVAGYKKTSYSNPEEIELEKSYLTLKAGKAKKIAATVCPEEGKFLQHTNSLRFRSSDTNVAKVTAKGKVKAVAAGSCKIYVNAVNGLTKTLVVTVK